jgi:hypothetical protein
MTMKVQNAIALAQEWVDQEATRMPHFVGAHLLGSVATLPAECTFPPYRDIDVNVVLEGDIAPEVHDIDYRGYILEYGLESWNDYASAEAVLSNPGLAPNLDANTILADPRGLLVPLQTAVAQEFTKRTWVVARCASMRREVDRTCEVLGIVPTPGEAYGVLVALTWALSGWLAMAALRPPTHRRALVLLREMLANQDALPLQEAVLDLLGVAHFDARRAEFYLAAAVAAFDRAVEVHRTPTPLDFKLQAHVRPYLVQGSQEMIDEGYPREAMSWIALGLLLANQTIQLDGPVEEQQIFQATVDQLLEECGFTAPGALALRRAEAAQLVADMSEVVERFIVTNRAIRDT